MIRVTPTDDRFDVVEGWDDRLFGDDDAFLPDALVRHRVTLKETASRKVERVVLRDGGCVVVKAYPDRPGVEGLGRRLLRDAATAEWRNGRALHAAGLPCATPVAIGRLARGAGGDGATRMVLVTEYLDDARELKDLWTDARALIVVRRRAVHGLARLIRRMHDAGFVHEDPHLSNFMVRGEDDEGEFDVVPIDLRRLRKSAALGASARRTHLLLLYQTMGLVGTRTDRLRFLETYLGDVDRETLRGEADAIEHAALRTIRRYRRRRSRSAYGSNRRFRSLDAGDVRWQVRRELEDDALATILDDPEAAFDAPDRVLKDGRSAQVVLVGRWVVKRLVPTRRRRLVLDRLRPGKAIRALRLAFLLEISGVPTARVAASGRLVSGGLVRRSYVVSELVPEASHVDVALTATSDRANLFGRIGEAIGRLHKEGLAHRDLKAGNLLVDAAGDVILVDLDGVRMVRDLGPERAAADLARLFRDLRGRADATSAEERGLLDAWSGWTAMDVDAIARRIERQRRLRPRGT